MLKEIELYKLKPHRLNEQIYGNEKVDETLLEDIKEKGILSPIVITKDYIIISGHRRWLIAKTLKMEKVLCEIKDFGTDLDAELALISYNKTRIKTYVQRMMERDEEIKLRKGLNISISSEQMAEFFKMSKGSYWRETHLWDSAKEDGEEAEYAKKQVDQIIKNDKSVQKAYEDFLSKKNEIKIRNARNEAANLGKVLANNEELHFGDFKEVLDFIPDETVDAIITDPPYPQEFLGCWEDLGKFAYKKLRPGGWLVAYSGQRNLPEVFERLSKSDLKYYWTFSLYHNGTRQDVWGIDVNVMWKPVLVYIKPPVMKLDNRGKDDFIISQKEEKFSHDWQQSESGFIKLIETFTHEKDLIVDPFVGSGIILIAGKKLNRKVFGAEIIEDEYNRAKNNLNNAFRPKPL